MKVISLQPVPNQEITVVPVNAEYTLMFRYFRGLMYATIRNEEEGVYIGAVRCTDRQWLIPWRRSGYGDGNFRFESENRQYPDFHDFGTSCRLAFYTADEIESGVD